ncbi:tyrosine-type recombinase/integrase [Albibacillus kandeliae]|uniref:tyrosine-type recombinase/integrase n=1 Tax=Albibacillus kandeliae TaxID=2174228 RepID=UPI0013005F63|nr:tyrosine-type recombinase/integrase [Albibacillus kandeliae]
MTRAFLAAQYVRDLPLTDEGQQLIYDTKLQGFGLRVGTTRKAYFCEGRTGGKKRRVTLGSADQIPIETARKLAKKAMAEMADNIDRNADRKRARKEAIPLAQASEAFFRARELRPKTRYDYERVLQRHFSDWLDRPLQEITPNDTVVRFDHISVTSGKASASLAVRTFSSIWNFTRHAYADEDGNPILRECPTQRISALKKMHKPVRRQEYVKDFGRFFSALESVQSFDFKIYFELLARTGARRSEISNLRWQDVDLEHQMFVFRDTKNHRDHWLPMSEQVERMFLLLRQRYGEGPYIWGQAPLGDPRKSLASFRNAYGAPLRAHDLRRTFSTLSERLGIPHYSIKHLLNHVTDGDVTGGYIIHDPERLRPEIQRISNEIDALSL